jgi:hypothetical protein
MAFALVATDAVVGLSQLRHATVIANEEGTTGLAIVLVLLALGYITLVYTFVVVKEY